MTQTGDPVTPSPPEVAQVILPRPNLGPEPWSEPVLTWGVTELVLGSAVAAVAVLLAVRKARHQRAWLGANAAGSAGSEPVGDTELSPGHRLIASSGAVRAALIAGFGPGWSSRTTEEIALDPTLGDRLGADTAGLIVAYLQRVDRAKFAGEDVEDVEEWIDRGHAILQQIAVIGPVGRRAGST